MPTINITPIEDDAEAVASIWNTRYNTIVDLLNGNLDADNIANLGVTTAKLANEAVTNSKIANTTIGPEKMQNPIAFRARRTSNQNVTGGVGTKLQAATEDYDYGEDYDNTTNYRFTAPVDGVYHFDGKISTTAAERVIAMLYVNGSVDVRGNEVITDTASGAVTSTVSADVYLDSGDYVELYGYADDTGVFSGSGGPSLFSGHLVGQVEV